MPTITHIHTYTPQHTTTAVIWSWAAQVQVYSTVDARRWLKCHIVKMSRQQSDKYRRCGMGLCLLVDQLCPIIVDRVTCAYVSASQTSKTSFGLHNKKEVPDMQHFSMTSMTSSLQSQSLVKCIIFYFIFLYFLFHSLNGCPFALVPVPFDSRPLAPGGTWERGLSLHLECFTIAALCTFTFHHSPGVWQKVNG